MVIGNRHTSVLLAEVLDALVVRAGCSYVDCTLGAGGHSDAILRAGKGTIRLLGIDADPEAISLAEERLAPWKSGVALVQGNFSQLGSIAQEKGFVPSDGILFDLGLSSIQLEESGRGFSFRYDAPLDMRFDPSQTRTAADIVNRLPERELADIIFRYGEEPRSRQIARAIVNTRPVTTTKQLVKIIESVVPKGKGRINVATKTFQSIRIAVNNELQALESALSQALDVLRPGGRLAVISFHSLEDRIVKQFLRTEARGCICPPRTPSCVCGRSPRLRVITNRAIKPGAQEVEANPRSRSARLRAAELLPS